DTRLVSDWSSDVCSSDLPIPRKALVGGPSFQCAPAPVSDRTSSSAYFSSSARSRDRTVPSQPHRNPIGIEMMPGLDSGNQCQSCFGNIAVSEPDTTGEKNTSSTAEPS